MKKNFISVVIPAYNEEKVIEKAVNSVLKSSYKKYEIIIVNNGSTDNTKNISERLVKKHPKTVKLLNFDPTSSKQIARSRGPAFSRNRGVEKAAGDILFFLDADDWVREDTLTNIIESFEKYKDIDFIVGNRKTYIPKNWRRIYCYGVIARNETQLNVESGHEIALDKNSPCPYIVKKCKFKKVGGFSEETYFDEDTKFVEKISEMKIPRLLSKKIVYYTDFRSSWADFFNQCVNVGKSFHHPFKVVRVLRIIVEMAIITILFPFFIVLMFFYMWFKTKDFIISITSPFLFTSRRIIEFYYFIKYF